MTDRLHAIDEASVAFAGIAGQSELLRSRELSARELTELVLRRIERLDGRLNAFRTVRAEQALAEADAAQRRLDSGEDEPLLGIPIAVKDNVDIAGEPTRHGTGAVTHVAEEDSEVVRRLRAGGAVMIGRTNLPELAMWGHMTESATCGPTRNPWNPDRATGGSSGGSAAAVAAGLATAALGSDGGASIRVPAALCGLFGLKPQRDRVPLAPDDDHWHGLTHFGPIARTVLDGALLLDVLAGPQREGPFAAAARTDPSKLTIGMAFKPTLPTPLKKPWRAAVERTAELLRSLGHEVVDAQPRYGSVPAVMSVMMPRYLGGVADDAARMDDPERLETRSRRMAWAGRRLHGRALTRARRLEPEVAARVSEPFERVDVLMTPTVAQAAFRVGRSARAGAVRTFNQTGPYVGYTAIWNYTGQPAAAVPAGYDDDRMPLSVQLVSRPDDERTLLSLCAQIEKARPWADARPPVS